MARKTKIDWLEEGLQILGEEGAMALKIETLTSRMGVTKGSFYHHFENFLAYKISLLDWAEQRGTLRTIALTEEAGTAAEKFDRIVQVSADEDSRIDVALRAWALQDPLVADYQERADRQRLAYIESLCLELISDVEQAHVTAQMLYALYVGMTQIIPPIQDQEMIKIFGVFKAAFKPFD